MTRGTAKAEMGLAAMESTRAVPPWYRQFWPWALMAGPAIVIVAGLTTFWIAVHTPDALVVDDYYKEGRAINLSLERDARAAELGLNASLDIGAGDGNLRVDIRAGGPMQWPPVLKLLLTHPVRAELDRTVEMRLSRTDDNTATYIGATDPLQKIAYQSTLQDFANQWRLINSERGTLRQTVQLRPGTKRMSREAAVN